MFNIPLASPFCIFYRTGLPPNPSSLNASNIRTLLAHRFHLLKLLVIINYIFIFVKRTLSFIILKPFPLTHVKTFSFPSFCTYTDFNTSWSNIFRSLFSNCKSFNFNLTSYKKSKYDSYVSSYLFAISSRIFLRASGSLPSRNCYIK